MSLDSSILISHLSGDVHKDEVLAAIGQLDVLKADVFLSLLCYAEVWTGIELLGEAERRQQTTEALYNMLQASRILLVSDNVTIARDAARVQAEYRRRGGRREVLIPDF
jgi:predicted nucleic acid-binding protein